MDDQCNVQWASDLGWRTGVWPTMFTYNGGKYQFDRYDQDNDGDIICAYYYCTTFPNRKRMKVYND